MYIESEGFKLERPALRNNQYGRCCFQAVVHYNCISKMQRSSRLETNARKEGLQAEALLVALA